MLIQENKLREIIEETGKVFERFDLTPMQGRILAYFTVTDPSEKTFEDMVKFFNASKSSISNSLNFLLQNNLIDYKTYSSDRKRYFYLTENFFMVYFKKVMNNVSELKSYAYKAVTIRTPEYPEVSEKILKWIGNANLFIESIDKVYVSINNEKE